MRRYFLIFLLSVVTSVTFIRFWCLDHPKCVKMYTINSLLTCGYSFTATPGLVSMFGANICFTKRQLKKTQNEANKPDQTNISAIKYQSLFASSV